MTFVNELQGRAKSMKLEKVPEGSEVHPVAPQSWGSPSITSARQTIKESGQRTLIKKRNNKKEQNIVTY